jgi:hypothetical protein
VSGRKRPAHGGLLPLAARALRPAHGRRRAGRRQWNLDHDNREPPPKRRPSASRSPWLPGEDDVDAQVREDLDRWERDGLVSFVGDDAPRWAPRPAGRRWPGSTTSSSTGSPTSGRPRTRCSAPTRGWPTAPCRRR